MSNQLEVRKMELKDEMKYRGTTVLTYTIRFPEFRTTLPQFRRAVVMINRYYRQQALQAVRYSRKNLYHDAVAQYLYAKENDYPIMVYEVDMDYTITYNENCTLSLYFDQYTFTGGAHGNTVRSSDTWSLQSGRQLPIERFVARPLHPKQYITEQVIRQIREQIANGDDYYFDDYEKNVVTEFDPDQFYLRPEGLVVYYQLYTIAPYVSGIREFLLPFSSAILPPRCRQ